MTWTELQGIEPSGDGACVELFTDVSRSCAAGCWNDLACPDSQRRPLCELDR